MEVCLVKLILKHVIRNLFETKLRTSLILLTIVFSTMVLFNGLSLNSIINNTYSVMLQGVYGKANVTITKSSNEESPFYEYSDLNLEDVPFERRLDQLQAKVIADINETAINVNLIGLDVKTAEEMELFTSLRELDDYLSKENFAIISFKTLKDYDLELGEEITVKHEDQTRILTIGAVSESTGLYYAERDEPLFITTLEQVNDLYETEKIANNTLLQIDEKNLTSALSTLKERNDSFVINQTKDSDVIQRDEESFKTVVLLSIIIIILISAYVLSSLSKLIIVERLPIMGTFRSIGLDRGKMKGILTIEFLVYGFIGSVIGIVLGYVLLPYTADIFNEYKDYAVETVVNYNVSYLLIAFFFGLLFPAAISFLRIHRTNKIPLKELILNTQHTEEKRSIVSTWLGFVFLIVSIALYFVNSYDQLLIAVLSLIALFFGLGLLMPVILNVFSRIFNRLVQNFSKGETLLGMRNVSNNKIASSNSSMIVIVFLLLLMIGITTKGIDLFIENTMKQDYILRALKMKC